MNQELSKKLSFAARGTVRGYDALGITASKHRAPISDRRDSLIIPTHSTVHTLVVQISRAARSTLIPSFKLRMTIAAY